MQKPKVKGVPLWRRQNILFMAAGILIGGIVTALAVVLLMMGQSQSVDNTAPVETSLPVETLLPFIVTSTPTLAQPVSAQMVIPQATVIAPRVMVARMSPDGHYMVVGAWDNAQGQLTRYDFSVQANLSGNVSTFASGVGLVDDMTFNTAGDRLAVMAGDSVWLYDMPSQNSLYRFQGYSRAAFSPDGKWLVVGGGNDGLRLMDAATLNFTDSIPVAGYVHSLLFSPDSQKLAVAVADASGVTRVRLMSMSDIHGTYAEYNAGGYVFQMAFHPSGNVLAVAADADVRVFDLKQGSQRFFPLDALSRVRSIAFSPDGSWLAVGGGDTGGGMVGAVYTWRWDETAILRPDDSWRDYHILTGHVHDVNSVSFTPDGAYLLSASSDGSVRLWDYRNGGAEVSRLQI